MFIHAHGAQVLAILTATVLSTSLAAPTQTSLANSTYYNPILPGWHSDPSCVQVNGTFFCATSTFQSFPGLPIYASKDLVNWRHVSNAWNREDQLPAINLQTPEQQLGMFAPNLRYHDGHFFMTCVYAGVNTTTQIIGTIFNTSNPYDDDAWSRPFVWDAPERTIDPDLFWDDDGKTYLTWSGIVQQTIDLSTGHLSETYSIWNGSTGVWAEGPHIYKKDGYYYLLAAEGGTQLGHRATIARSRNITGPYESNPANPIVSNTNISELFQTVGHADLFEDTNGNWWGVALATRSGPEYNVFPMGRETCLFPVTWPRAGWPYAAQVRGTMSGWPLPKYNKRVPGKGAFNNEDDVIDFKPESRIPGHFLYFRYPPNNTFHVSPAGHPNTLQVLATRANLTGVQDSADLDLNGQSGLTYVGRRQTHSLFTFSVDLLLQPHPSGFEAGATTFFTQWQHLDIGIVSNGTAGSERTLSATLVLRATNATSSEKRVQVPESWHAVSNSSVRLEITALNTTHYRFSASPVDDLNQHIVLGDLPAALVTSTWGEQAGSGAAVQVGIYATTNGREIDVMTRAAYFSRWSYTGHGQEVDFGTFVSD